MEPDLTVFEREVYRRADLGEAVEDLCRDFGLPHHIVTVATARGDASLAGIANADGAYKDRLLWLARRRPGLFQIGEIPWDAAVEYSDEAPSGGVDTDDIDDPFGPQAPNGGLLGGIT